MSWSKDSGIWTFKGKELVQTATEKLTRCHQSIGDTDYIASFQVNLIEARHANTGEAKFIFSDAEAGEDYRVDFLYAYQACWIRAKGWGYRMPLELIVGATYLIRILVKGNLLSVRVDGMPIINDFQFGKRSNGIVGFGTWEASAEFKEVSIAPLEQKNCFVIMPFDEKRNFLYETVIKPTLVSHPSILFDVIRADESLTVGKISEEIGHYVHEADLVIADISEANENVYYELGYSHALNRKAVLLVQKTLGEKLSIPFDIQDFRCHPYSFTKEGLAKLEKHLAKLVKEIMV